MYLEQQLMRELLNSHPLISDHNYVYSNVISIKSLFSVGRVHSYDNKDYTMDAT